jgi:hypothetical protein
MSFTGTITLDQALDEIGTHASAAGGEAPSESEPRERSTAS